MYKGTEVYAFKTETVQGQKFVYSYRLLESNLVLEEGQNDNPIHSYGIEIILDEIKPDGKHTYYTECCMNVSPDRNKVMALLKKLRNYEVSPVHLIDVIGEEVDKWVSDYNIVSAEEVSEMMA